MKRHAVTQPDRNPKPVLRCKAGSVLVLSLLLQACGDGDKEPGSGDKLSIQATATSCTAFPASPSYSGSAPSPEQVLGVALGSRELSYDEINRYLDALDKTSNRVITGVAATSAEKRQIRYAIVGREDRLTRMGLETVRKAIAKLSDPDTPVATAAALADSTPAILWISANVHGNEESGADASLRVLHDLADRDDCAATAIRDNAVVVILPMQNPDGREANTRRNAYGFDMNRDWFARTQPETDGKLELLRQYRPVLHIDAHETSLNHYFFPPTADPTYHEVPQTAFGWINTLYSPAIASEFDRRKIAYFHGAPYDLYAVEYGDSVTTVGFHAAGMTFEKYSGSGIADRINEHYTAMWSSLFAAAGSKSGILNAWYASHVEARRQGASGMLAPNGLYYDGKSLYQQVPSSPVRHYFLLRDNPERAADVDQLVRRLQRMDVKAWQLQAPLEVPDYHPYGGSTTAKTLPAGSYWIPMAQARKHWIQAMLHHDPYLPVSVSYDVSAWSNPLLMNLDGGSSGTELKPRADLVAPVPTPVPPGPPAGAPRLGLFEIPGSTGFESAGAARHLFERVWGVPFSSVRADRIATDLGQVDVLLVPDGYANSALQALGSKGQKALTDWVGHGGRYVGYLGGTELAVKTGISTAVLTASHTAAPGTLIRVNFEPSDPTSNPLARGMSQAWIMYNDNAVMSTGMGMAAASFPAGAQTTSGLAIGVEELAGSAAVIDEAVGSGRSIVFSFDPNFRGWTEGTQRILWNALFGPAPATLVTAASDMRQDAVDAAKRAVKALPDTGKAIRIVVRQTDADTTRALLQRYGAEFRESRKGERTVFVIANREGLDREEHPYALELARELKRQLNPISFSMP